MRIETIDHLRELLTKALALRGISGRDADILCDDFLAAQMEGKTTHGIGKFLLIDAALSGREGKPEVVKQTESYALVNGNKELGQLAASFCVDLLADKAANSGIAMVGMFNAARYGRLSHYGRMLGDRGLIGIVLNNGGPAAVVPFQGIDPLFGTNPICFTFPSEEGPLVFDFGTSEKVWGEIRQAILEQRKLPDGAFLDKAGQFTRDPEAAEAVIPFGDAKGYALCLAIEILTGALVTAKMGLEVQDQYDLGFLFIAISPSVFTDLAVFQSEVTRLATAIRSSRGTLPGISPRVPGEQSNHNYQVAAATGQISIDPQTYDRLLQMSESQAGGLSSSNKVD